MNDSDEDAIRILFATATPEPRRHYGQDMAGDIIRRADSPVADRATPTRTRPRWGSNPLALVTATVAIVAGVSVGGLAIAGWNHHNRTDPGTVAAPSGSRPAGLLPVPTAATSTVAPPPPTSPQSTSPSTASHASAPAEACTPHDLSATVASSGEAMGSSWIVASLTNSGANVCSVSGYASILGATGKPASSATTPASLDVTELHGGTIATPDPGARALELAPKASARFTISSVTSYQGGAKPFTVTGLTVSLPGTPEPIILAIPSTRALTTSALPGQPFALTVSAFS